VIWPTSRKKLLTFDHDPVQIRIPDHSSTLCPKKVAKAQQHS